LDKSLVNYKKKLFLITIILLFNNRCFTKFDNSLKVLSGVMGIMAPSILKIFPDSVANTLSTVFNMTDGTNFMQHIQEIIDTIDISEKNIEDTHPNFNPLSKEREIPYQMINDTGLRELKGI
jgi:hypothetical protein